MLDVIWSIAGFIVALSILVCFHEYGHYWMARKLGVRVLRFCLGWGKPWKSFMAKDGVEWAIAPYPIGGYVKMLDEREAPVADHEKHLAFNNQPIRNRMAILVAGPAANFLLAIVLYWLILMIGVEGLKPIISEPPARTAAAAAGMRAGDTVTQVGERPIDTWTDLRLALIDNTLGAQSMMLRVRSEEGVSRPVQLNLADVRSDPEFLFDDIGLNVFQPVIEPVLDRIVPGSAADAAQLRAGDRITEVEDTSITNWNELVAAIKQRPMQATRLVIERDGKALELNLVVGTHEQGGVVIGRLGATPVVNQQLWQNLRAVRQLGPLEAVPEAVGQTWQMSQLTLRVLWHMVLGEVSVKNVSGPIQIAQVAGDTARIGLVSFLSFMAVVSVSLGVLNLLPVPLLDGGHMLMYAIEGVKGRPLSERAQITAQYVGLAFIGVLMMLALYNDIMRLV